MKTGLDKPDHFIIAGFEDHTREEIDAFKTDIQKLVSSLKDNPKGSIELPYYTLDLERKETKDGVLVLVFKHNPFMGLDEKFTIPVSGSEFEAFVREMDEKVNKFAVFETDTRVITDHII
jgi:hypothetical protein